jgi:Tfp pilus assembly protein PilF
LLAAAGACQTAAQPGILRIVDGRPMLTPVASEEAYAHFLRAELWLNRGDAQAAVREFQKALAADPPSPYIRTR